VVLNNVLYDPFGPVRGWTWGNSTLMARTYDLDGKITQVDSAGLKTYGYDDAFRITNINDAAVPSNNWTYGYDNLDRLTAATKAVGPTRGWTYDANGNRLTETGTSASTFSVSSTSNRLSSTSGALARTYAYDAAGSVTTYVDVTLSYNNRGRLKSTKKGTVTRNYIYNALGQMARATGGTGGTVLYMYDEAGHVIGEYTSTGALTQETVWLGDIPVATIRPGTPVQIFYVHTDHLNTPRIVTRPSDNKKRWLWDNDTFGTNAPNNNPEALGAFTYNLRFPGQVFDGQAGLHYNYFRDYDSAIGRYVESDPIGLDGGVNTYWYADADPASKNDPTGEFAGSVVRLILQLVRSGASANRGAAAAAAAAAGVSSTTPQSDSPEKRRERDAYHRRCDEPPPSGLTQCDLIRWKIQRAKDCIRMRQDYIDKWKDTYQGHRDQVAERQSALRNLEKQLSEYCCGS
jgi:RHS repeat-associated protein